MSRSTMNRFPALAGLASLALLAACSDGPALPGAAAARPAEADVVSGLTRDLAVSLRDGGLRRQVKDDMRAALNHEHKLELRAYLGSPAGAALLADMARQNGRTPQAELERVRSVRPLEFYMPVAAQRATWTGEAPVLVAYQIDNQAAPVGFDMEGRRVALSRTAPPAQPVLSVVPVETDFAHPMIGGRFRNVRDAGGRALGTLGLVDCEQQVGGTEGDCATGDTGQGGGPVPAGLYMNYSQLPDLGESWAKGEPEIEVMVIGPDENGNVHELTCAGEHQSGMWYFDQNSNGWQGTVRLMTAAQAEQYHFMEGEGRHFMVQVWEDDDEPCKIRTDKDLKQMARVAAGLGLVDGYTIIHDVNHTSTAWDPNVCRNSWCVLGVVATLGVMAWDVANIIQTNDDYLGTAVLRSTTDDTSYPGYSHVLFVEPDGSQRNGAVNIVWRDQ